MTAAPIAAYRPAFKTPAATRNTVKPDHVPASQSRHQMNLSATWVCEMEEKTGVSIESRVDCEAKQGKGGNCSPRFAHSNNSATNQGLSELRSVLLVAELPRLRHRHSSRPETMHRPSASLGPEGPEGAPSGTRKTRGRHIAGPEI